MSDMKRIAIEDTKIVRVKHGKGRCQIAGAIEGETKGFLRTVKTFQGYFIRHRIAKDKAHTEPCDSCPSHTSIKNKWFKPGRDVRDLVT